MEIVLGDKGFITSSVIKDGRHGIIVSPSLNEPKIEGDEIILTDSDIIIWFDSLAAVRMFQDSLALIALAFQGIRRSGTQTIIDDRNN